MTRKRYRVKPIIILNPINFWGRVAVSLIKFSGWLYQATGNEWDSKKKREWNKTHPNKV